MQETFQISFPATASGEDINAVQSALKDIDGITSTGSVASRTLEPGSIMIWVELVAGVLGGVSAALPLVQKVIKIVRGKGISGVNIKLPNGADISIDNATASEIERLLRTVEQSPT